MKILSCRIRASYPNYYMVELFARMGCEVFNHDSEDPANQLEGNKPGTVIYRLEGDETLHEFPPRWYDMYCLLQISADERIKMLKMLLEERDTGRTDPALQQQRDDFRQRCRDYVDSHPLIDSNDLITTLSKGDFTDEGISYKGRMLMELSRGCYPVPDFCILTASSFKKTDELPVLLRQAISNLETMTSCRLGDTSRPLVFALRCAMPQYIPGLMPTVLNVGVTRDAYQALCLIYGNELGIRVYTSTLLTLCEMLKVKGVDRKDNTVYSEERIAELERLIDTAPDGGPRLTTDAHYQALRIVEYVRGFYRDNSDLILTFMQGREALPSMILQRMVWTVGNDDSYPGVLYSRHSRTGVGKQIESHRNIFGEEIMTGNVTTDDLAYRDRNEIRRAFPAVYHFDPLLKKLEQRLGSPATIEFAVESRPNEVSLFSVLQLNASELTGRAALVSSIQMRNEGLINDVNVMDIIKPYHLRQIVSDTIDDHSLERLTFFARGLSVLPSSAITSRLCFSIVKARELKAAGNHVCLCQQQFIPEDTITLNEVDAILSLMPAAIHVVTACRGYGIPALMDLMSYGIRMTDDGHGLQTADGLTVLEGDLITLSSKQNSLFLGEAAFKPARFTKYLQHQNVDLADDEKDYFEEMRVAYEQYQSIVTSQKASYITDINKLARLIRCDLHNKPEIASEIVNNWYESRPEEYLRQVLQSRMGDHNDQSRLFNLLRDGLKVDFLQRACTHCCEQRLSGLRAGSFMLGRFVARPLPSNVWNRLSNRVVAFLLNEYVLYEKYLLVLQEVGEIKLARAHSRIETEGIDNMVVCNFDIINFLPLLESHHDWQKVATELEAIEHQDNTHLFIEKLQQRAESNTTSKGW